MAVDEDDPGEDSDPSKWYSLAVQTTLIGPVEQERASPPTWRFSLYMGVGYVVGSEGWEGWMLACAQRGARYTRLGMMGKAYARLLYLFYEPIGFFMAFEKAPAASVRNPAENGTPPGRAEERTHVGRFVKTLVTRFSGRSMSFRFSPGGGGCIGPARDGPSVHRSPGPVGPRGTPPG